ncbi:hypothetical protein EV1_033496 [Malus domestica]
MVLPYAMDCVVLEHVGHVVGGNEGIFDSNKFRPHLEPLTCDPSAPSSVHLVLFLQHLRITARRSIVPVVVRGSHSGLNFIGHGHLSVVGRGAPPATTTMGVHLRAVGRRCRHNVAIRKHVLRCAVGRGCHHGVASTSCS